MVSAGGVERVEEFVLADDAVTMLDTWF